MRSATFHRIEATLEWESDKHRPVMATERTQPTPSDPSNAVFRRGTVVKEVAGLVIAVIAGLGMAIQSRVNGELSTRLGDVVLAAVISFGTGLLLLLLLLACSSRMRSGLSHVVPALRAGLLRPWHFLGGLAGATYVLGQAGTVALIGVALFTVGVVAGQTVSGLAVDKFGTRTAGRRAVTWPRTLGAVLMVGAVGVAVGGDLVDAELGRVWVLVLPVLAGMGMAVQQAFNGRIGAVVDSPLTAALVNFTGGYHGAGRRVARVAGGVRRHRTIRVARGPGAVPRRSHRDRVHHGGGGAGVVDGGPAVRPGLRGGATTRFGGRRSRRARHRRRRGHVDAARLCGRSGGRGGRGDGRTTRRRSRFGRITVVTATILDGRATKDAIFAELAPRVSALTEQGRTPGLATVLVGDDPGSHAYVKMKHADCAKVGINSIRRDLPGDISQEELFAVVDELNADPACSGYIVQLPLPKHLDENAVLQRIDPAKDVDGSPR